MGISSFMAAIRQPSPELLALFDTCCIMSRGRCVYWGPTNEAAPFFVANGFVCPTSKSEPDFLEELSGSPESFMDGVGAILHAEFNDEATTESAEDLLSPAAHGMAGPTSLASAVGGESAPDEHVHCNDADTKKQLAQNMQSQFRQSKHYRNLGLTIWNQMSGPLLLFPSHQYVW